MTANGALQIGLYLAALVALSWPLGVYMAHVYANVRTWLSRRMDPLERTIYKLAGVDPTDEHTWTQYTAAVLAFNLLGFIVVYLLQRMQGQPSASTPRDLRVWRRIWPSTPPSVSRPTPTGKPTAAKPR